MRMTLLLLLFAGNAFATETLTPLACTDYQGQKEYPDVKLHACLETCHSLNQQASERPFTEVEKNELNECHTIKVKQTYVKLHALDKPCEYLRDKAQTMHLKSIESEFLSRCFDQ